MLGQQDPDKQQYQFRFNKIISREMRPLPSVILNKSRRSHIMLGVVTVRNLAEQT